MTSNYNTKYIQLPLSVFAVEFPADYVDLVTHRGLPADALFDDRYIVRIKLYKSGGHSIEVGYATDDWVIR